MARHGRRDRAQVLGRSNGRVFDPELMASVAAILEEVRTEGDAACSRALALRRLRCAARPAARAGG
ncbi:MAG: hypothetical protein U0Y82_13195 [Thermoleophilia bacterium]